MPQCGCTEVFMKAAVNQTFDNTAHFLSWTMFLLSVKLQTDTKLLCWSLFEELRGADVSSDLQDKDFKLQWFIRDQLSVEISWSHRTERVKKSNSKELFMWFLFLYGGEDVWSVLIRTPSSSILVFLTAGLMSLNVPCRHFQLHVLTQLLKTSNNTISYRDLSRRVQSLRWNDLFPFLLSVLVVFIVCILTVFFLLKSEWRHRDQYSDIRWSTSAVGQVTQTLIQICGSELLICWPLYFNLTLLYRDLFFSSIAAQYRHKKSQKHCMNYD